MTITLASKPGLSSTTTLNIPSTWNATWFRNLISNQLKGADVRNAEGTNGITVSGTIASPYATISFGGPATVPGVITFTGQVIIAPTTVVTPLILKPNSGGGGEALDLWAATANGGAFVAGYNSTGATRTGYLDFISGTGGGGGATETALDNDGTTVNDWLSLITGGTRRVRVDGTGHVTINAPGSGVIALTVNGGATAFPLYLNSPAASTTSGIILEQGGSITAEMGADGSQIMYSGSTNGDFVLRQLSGSIWIIVSSTTLAMSISSTGAIGFASVTTAATATAGSIVPTDFVGFFELTINGTVRKIPYYSV
jgi:hypothetical protein